jgi:hypothetical protein
MIPSLTPIPPYKRFRHELGRSVLLLFTIALFVLSSICYSVTLTLIPSVVFNGAPLETRLRVQFTPPEGWALIPPIGNSNYRGPYSLVTYSPRPEPSFPVVELQVVANVKPKVPFKGQLPPQDPMGTRAVSNMRSAGPILSVRKVGHFDGKQNGPLTLWRAHGIQYDVYTTTIASGNVWVDLSLRCDDSKLLKPYLTLLKESSLRQDNSRYEGITQGGILKGVVGGIRGQGRD